MITARAVIERVTGHPASQYWAVVFHHEPAFDEMVDIAYVKRKAAQEMPIGVEVIYTLDDQGVVVGYTPVDQWNGDPITSPERS